LAIIPATNLNIKWRKLGNVSYIHNKVGPKVYIETSLKDRPKKMNTMNSRSREVATYIEAPS